MIIYIHLHTDKIISVATPIYRFDLYFLFVDFMIRFTDFIVFLSPCMG